jgi:hypothetical protein
MCSNSLESYALSHFLVVSLRFLILLPLQTQKIPMLFSYTHKNTKTSIAPKATKTVRRMGHGKCYKKMSLIFLQIPPFPFHASISFRALVRTLERWNGLALCLIKSMGSNSTVPNINLAVRRLLPSEGMLHPFLVITVWVILSCVGTTGFLSVCCSFGGLDTIKRLAMFHSW